MKNNQFRSILHIIRGTLRHMLPTPYHKRMEDWLDRKIDRAMLRDNRFIQKHVILWHWPEHMPYALDLKHPKTFSEKIQWLKINYRDYRIPVCADKYLAKKYLAKKGYGKYIPKNLGVFTDMESFQKLYKSLPERFVVKSSEGCGGVSICYDKAKWDMSELEGMLQEWKSRCYASSGGEWFYDVFEPTFFVEEYIEQDPEDRSYVKSENGGMTEIPDLYDYKFFCFHGEPVYSYLTMNRQSHENMTFDFYDKDWNFLNFTRLYPNSGKIMPRPRNYEKMLEIARKVSEGFPLVRVDFMEGNGQLYIGELTFCPGGGWECFEPITWDRKFGDYLKLPSKEECRAKEKEYKAFLKRVAAGTYRNISLRSGRLENRKKEK